MSARRWNSIGERRRLCDLIDATQERMNVSGTSSDMDLSQLLFADHMAAAEYYPYYPSSDSSGGSYDPSSESEGSSSFDDDVAVEQHGNHFFLDLSILSDITADGLDISSDTVDGLLEVIDKDHQHLYDQIEGDRIDFTQPFMLIRDLHNDNRALHEFRFRKDHLQEIADVLWERMALFLVGPPFRIVCENGYTCPYETGFLLCLYRLSFPRRLSPDMEAFFCMRKSHLSACLKTFMAALHLVANPYFTSAARWQHRFELYSEKIATKAGCDGLNVWGFIDGTLRKTCRPSRFQRLLYSGHKRCHGIKFQSVTTPDGYIALLFGPIPGNRHDSFMLRESGLLEELETMFPTMDHFYSLFGDPAYPQTHLLFGGYRNPATGSPEAMWNTKMSSVRESVEWMFGSIVQYWRFLDFRASMKVFLFPVANYYRVGAFLLNLHNSLYAGKCANYFDVDTYEKGAMSLREYIDLVDIAEYAPANAADDSISE